jgi:hypothetical protein
MENCVLDGDGAVEGSCLMNTLQPGDSLVASGYCLYSSSCMFVFTVGSGLQGFTYDRAIGEFVLTHPNIQIPKRGKIYSVRPAPDPHPPEGSCGVALVPEPPRGHQARGHGGWRAERRGIRACGCRCAF